MAQYSQNVLAAHVRGIISELFGRFKQTLLHGRASLHATMLFSTSAAYLLHFVFLHTMLSLTKHSSLRYMLVQDIHDEDANRYNRCIYHTSTLIYALLSM